MTASTPVVAPAAIDPQARRRATVRRTVGVLLAAVGMALLVGLVTRSVVWTFVAGSLALWLVERWQAYGSGRLLIALPRGEAEPPLRIDAYDAWTARLRADTSAQLWLGVGRDEWMVSRDELAAVLVAILPHLNRDDTDAEGMSGAAQWLRREVSWEGVLATQLRAHPMGVELAALDTEVRLALESGVRQSSQ